MAYGEDSPSVLRNISFAVNAGEKIGTIYETFDKFYLSLVWKYKDYVFKVSSGGQDLEKLLSPSLYSG